MDTRALGVWLAAKWNLFYLAHSGLSVLPLFNGTYAPSELDAVENAFSGPAVQSKF